MKQFKKTEDGLFICEECGSLCKTIKGLSSHIKQHKITRQDYFDKWLKHESDGKCKICQTNTPFISLSFGLQG